MSDEMISASKRAFLSDYSPMGKLFTEITSPLYSNTALADNG